MAASPVIGAGVREKMSMGNEEHSKTFWFTFGVLLLFWVLITWRLHWQHLLVGAVSCYAVTRFNQGLLLLPAERPLLVLATAGKWAWYFLLLVVAVFKANWDVAKIVLQPKMEISPGFVKYRTKVRKPLNRVILGNSITLTPGTLTVEIADDLYVVHALTRAGAEDCADWELMNNLAEMEKAEEVGKGA